MDRRHFCKIATLTMGALGLSGSDAIAAAVSSPKISREETLPVGCKVAVVRRECYSDLQSLYLDDPEEGPCRAFSTGDSFELAAGASCPKEFCPRAWRMVCNALKEGGGCAATLRHGLLLLSCPDGTRPVVFRIDF